MARLDTGWHCNPKVLAAGIPGMALHAWSISYCDAARSDGFVPDGAWPYGGSRAAREGVQSLLKVGLWEPAEGGYRVHDYPQYNRSRAQIEADQEDARQRQSRHRSRVTEPVTNGVTNAEHSRAPDARSRTGDRAPGPGPGDVVSPDLLKNGSTPLAGQGLDAQGAPPTRPSLAEDSQPLATVHADYGVCPLCRKPYQGAYLDHTEKEHAVRAQAEPGNLGGAMGRRRRRGMDNPDEWPDEVKARMSAEPIKAEG